MLPKVAPLIDKIRLYSDFARMGKHNGHLSVDLEVCHSQSSANRKIWRVNAPENHGHGDENDGLV